MVFLEWMPFLMCMQRPKSASRKLMSRKKRAVAVAQLPGVGKFTLNRATHHPLCPSADDRTASVKVLNSANDIPQDPDTAMFYPLSPDALRAIDAIEYITDHIVQEKEYKMSASRKLMSRKKRAVAVAQLPGVGKFTLNRATHHPLCPSADDRTASVKVLNSANDIPQDPDTAMFYPLSPDALRAIDAIEYITDHIVQEKEYKM
ncbi:hypothetical protein OSTOST_10153, partial [Ostertagia ostertagi]